MCVCLFLNSTLVLGLNGFLVHLSDGYIVCSFHISRHGEAVDRTLLKSLLRMLADLQVNS